MKLRLTAKIQNAGGVKEVYDYVVKGKGREEWRDEYDFVSKFLDGLAAVQLNGKWGMINRDGEEVVPLKYDYVEYFHEGLAKVNIGGVREDDLIKCYGGKWGYVDQQGNEVVPLKYDIVGSFFWGLAEVNIGGEWYEDEDEDGLVNLGGKWGFVDMRGNEYWDMTVDEARRQIENR